MVKVSEMKNPAFIMFLLSIIFLIISCSVQKQTLTSQSPNINWERDNRNKVDFKAYYDKHFDNLDNIEGIWSVSASYLVSGSYQQDELNYVTVAIIKDTVSSDRDFYEVILSGKGFIPNTITAYFQKSSYDDYYFSKQYEYDGSYSMFNFILDKNGVLKSSINRIINGNQVYTEMSYVKIYPKYSDKNFSNKKSESNKNWGSGLLISSNGIIVTNYHVVENAKNIDVIFPEKNITKNALVKLKDSKNDIALLEIKDFSYPELFNYSIPFVIADVNSVKIGDESFTLGFPLGDILGTQSRFSSGVVNSLYGLQDDPRLLQISNPLQPGNSGGPLFNLKGELIGIVVSSLNAKYFYDNVGIIPQNVNFAIKTSYLSNLLSMIPEGDDIAKRENSVNQAKLDVQIEQLNPFVVQIKTY